MKENPRFEVRTGQVEKEEPRRVRLKPINRRQMMLRPVEVEKLVAEDHEVRAIWEFVASEPGAYVPGLVQ